MEGNTNLGESTVVPNIAVVREAVADESKFALFDILLDRIEGFLLGDLHFGVGPTRDFDDHIQDTIVPICKQGDIMEGGDDIAILFDIHAMLCGRFERFEVLFKIDDDDNEQHSTHQAYVGIR